MRMSVKAGLVLVALSPVTSFAQSILPNPLDRTFEDMRQKRQLDQEQAQRDSLTARERLGTNAPRAGSSSSDALVRSGCIDVRAIAFRGAQTLPDAIKHRVQSRYAGRCLSSADLDRLLDEINDWYVDKGYVTSHAFVPESALNAGVLTIASVEGRVGRVYFSAMEKAGGDLLRQSFPAARGDVLNLRDIEQAVEQLDRVSPGVRVSIRAAAQEGYSDVVFIGEPQSRVAVTVSADNNGATNTGRNQLGASIALTNFAGHGEQLQAWGGNSFSGEDGRFRRSAGIAASLPMGYWTLGYTGATGRFDIPLRIGDAALSYHGKSLQNRLTASRTVHRDARSKTDVIATAAHYDSRVYLEDLALEKSSERLTSAQLGLSHAMRIGDKASLTVTPVYSQGLSPGGVDPSEAGDANPRFRKGSIGASVYVQMTPRMSWLSSAYVQTSPDVLPGSERVVVGGDTSVRGFRDRYLSGDTGGYLRNQINWRVPAPSWAGNVSMGVAADAGRVVPVAGEPLSGGTVVGSAIFASAAFKHFSGSVSVGKPLRAPAQLDADPLVAGLQLATSF